MQSAASDGGGQRAWWPHCSQASGARKSLRSMAGLQRAAEDKGRLFPLNVMSAESRGKPARCSCETTCGASWWQGALMKLWMEQHGGHSALWVTPKAACERRVARWLAFVTPGPVMGGYPTAASLLVAALGDILWVWQCSLTWGSLLSARTRCPLGTFSFLRSEVVAKAVCAGGCQLSPGRLSMLSGTCCYCWVSGIVRIKPPAPWSWDTSPGHKKNRLSRWGSLEGISCSCPRESCAFAFWVFGQPQSKCLHREGMCSAGDTSFHAIRINHYMRNHDR